MGNDENLVSNIKNALYRLKQAPHALYYCLDKYLQQQGFTKWYSKSNVYTKIVDDKLLIIFVYVDDIISGSNEESMSQNFPYVI